MYNFIIDYTQADLGTITEPVTVAEAKQYMEEGQFGEDDMLPKIQAAIDFIGDSAIRSVLITKLNKDGTYVSGGPGTMITK